MARKKKESDSEITPQERLEKARARLRTAEERYADTRQRCEIKVEKARQKAEALLSKASERVQRRADAVALAEAQLAEDGSLQAAEDELRAAVGDSHASEPASRDLVGTSYAQERTVTNGASGLRVREQRALETLQALKLEGDGVTAQQWRALAGMSAATFARARNRLVETGVVRTSMESGVRARYTPAASHDANGG